jgi:hypothetical protein
MGPADQRRAVDRRDDDDAALAYVQRAEKLLQVIMVERGGDDTGKAAVPALSGADAKA